jgi:type I restriction enzyme S subunit
MLSDKIFRLYLDKKRSDPRFIAYSLGSLDARRQIEGAISGAEGLANNLPQSAVRSISVSLPSVGLQRHTARFLDRKVAVIDELIAKKERLVAVLQEKRQTLILQAVTSSFTGLGDGGKEISWAQNSLVRRDWAIGKLCYLARIGNGSTPSREEPSYWSRNAEGVPWLNSSKINDERIEHADDWVSETALRECHLPRIGAGSVLVALTGEGQTRGRAALLLMDATISQHLAYVVPARSRLRAEFLWYQLQAMYSWLRGESSGGGSTRAALTCQFLRSIPVVVPPLEEQDKVIVELQERLSNLDSLKLSLSASIKRLREYRQALITAAVTGKIDLPPESAPPLSASPSPASIGE